VIPAFVRQALSGEALTIAGAGNQSRRFVYVEDLAEGVAASLRSVAANRVYNLVSDRDVSIKEIAHTVREQVGDVEVVHTAARPADFGGVVVCGQRAERELGWKSHTPFEEGVRRYVEWYRAEVAATGNGAAAVEPVAAPATTPVTAAPVRPPVPRRSDALVALGRLTLPVGLFVGVLSMLASYLVAVHRVGMGWDDARTVGMTILVGLGLYLATRLKLDGLRRGAVITLVWAVAGAYLVATLVPWTRALFDLSRPDVVTVLLGVAGAGFGIALMAAALRFVRARRALEHKTRA
jgi:hypothetical protein